MRTHGKITHWNSQKAYGFITPASGDKRVFVHVRAFMQKGHEPAVDQRVTFELSTNRQGRPCAARVSLLGEEPAKRHMRNDKKFYSAGAVGFLVIVGLSVLTAALPLAVLLVYLAASALSYFLYAWDKDSAKRGAQRTAENTLHLFDLLGGWPGAMAAQQVLRRKSSKKEFRFVFWMTVVINCVVFAWLFTDAGQRALRSILASI
jgi:uncharacterized membrane protein YsdA (DUF1294 family)/cold shock CspA family protein